MAWRTLYFTSESQLCKSVQCAYRSKKIAQAKHAMKAFKNKHCGSRSPTYIELTHFTLLLAEDSKEMYQDSKRTCVTIVLLINFLFDVALARGFLNNPLNNKKSLIKPRRQPTGTSLNKRFNEQNKRLCTCVINLATFLCRSLQNNDMK